MENSSSSLIAEIFSPSLIVENSLSSVSVYHPACGVHPIVSVGSALCDTLIKTIFILNHLPT